MKSFVAILFTVLTLFAVESPLHEAVYRDDFATAKRLLAGGADAKATNRYGITPLSLASANGNAEVVTLLLKAGADANTTSPGGETVLMAAARSGRNSAVSALLQAGAAVNAKERRGQTAIMWAAAEGHTDVVKTLIAAGADFKAQLDSGFSPLTFAVREGHKETALALIEAGADVREAMQPKHPSARSVRKGTSSFMLAVENGHFELALALLDKGADPNDDRCGYTALHALSWVRKPPRGEEPEALPPPDGSGKITSLGFVRALAAHGAELNPRIKTGSSGKGEVTRQGATPFFLAAATDDLPLMRLLVELGADPNLRNIDETTPIMTASGLGVLAVGEEGGTEEEAVEAVKYLISSLHQDVNAVDNRGETAMHGAAYKAAPRVVHLLAENGAKIDVWNRTNKWGWTPIMIAEGFRPGNFRPSFETLEALHDVMRSAGVTPPPPTPRFAVTTNKEEEWSKAAAKKTVPQ